jgi:hypothetical protein
MFKNSLEYFLNCAKPTHGRINRHINWVSLEILIRE